jgi:hypothetical protein
MVTYFPVQNGLDGSQDFPDSLDIISFSPIIHFIMPIRHTSIAQLSNYSMPNCP